MDNLSDQVPQDGGDESLERPEKRRKLEEIEDATPADDAVRGLERDNAMEVKRQYDSGGEDAEEKPNTEQPGTTSQKPSGGDRYGIEYDDEGYPILTDQWVKVKKEYLLRKSAVEEASKPVRPVPDLAYI